MNQHVIAAAIAALMIPGGSAASAQTRDAAKPSASREQRLAEGWSALAAGRPSAAAQAATRLLKASPHDHDGVSLAIAAALALNTPMSALDGYEQWLPTERSEDMYLLERIAAGVLRDLIADSNDDVRFRAMEMLAKAGDAWAQSQTAAMKEQVALTGAAEEMLARLGDERATRRLVARLRSGGAHTPSAIDALASSEDPAAHDTIAAALANTATPSKLAALRALTKLRSKQYVAAIRETLNDQDPTVRGLARIALATLGDSESISMIEQLSQSDVPDLKIIGLRLQAATNPAGPWRQAAEELLRQPDALVSIEAAQLLLQTGPSPAAMERMLWAVGQSNPATRAIAMESLSKVPPTGVSAALRKLLRDPNADVRLRAAGALLGWRAP